MNRFTLAFAACNNARTHPSQPGWLQLAQHGPDALVLLGDNAYLERTPQEVLRGNRPVERKSDAQFAQRLHRQYAAQAAVAQMRQCLQKLHQTPGFEVLATLDDHDFLGNDVYISEAWEGKASIARALHRQFVGHLRSPASQSYPSLEAMAPMLAAGERTSVGLAQVQDFADIRLIVLDNRSFRQRPGPAAQALGAAQVAWLAQQLVGSQALTVIASGSPVPKTRHAIIVDSPLAAYAQEAERVLQLLAAHASHPIVWVGGDLHLNEYWIAGQGGTKAALHRELPHVLHAATSGMGSGWQPFAAQTRDNFLTLHWQGAQGNQPAALNVVAHGRRSADRFEIAWDAASGAFLKIK